ncbi:hypothetical protein ASZ90_005688 [hydrocarbon metagenome]|uniref:Uncharacterized protein n=1 Tax=hydrocarbon metagenome TaxID=938273 RepID=A0A0W8FUC3_9ZZZZ
MNEAYRAKIAKKSRKKKPSAIFLSVFFVSLHESDFYKYKDIKNALIAKLLLICFQILFDA